MFLVCELTALLENFYQSCLRKLVFLLHIWASVNQPWRRYCRWRRSAPGPFTTKGADLLIGEYHLNLFQT